MVNIKELFEKYEDEFLEDSNSGPRDLEAFNILHRLVPVKHNIVECAEHDQIWLSTDIDELAKVATEQDIKRLQQLGVMYDDSTDSLSMYR